MIYCVEDDANIRELIVYTLQSTGFDTCGFSDAEAFFDTLNKTLPELILLDIVLPKKDGLAIMSDLKKSARTKNIPVILITAKDSEFDIVNGLNLGADDYITKPFGMMEMVSRVKAVLRRCESKGNTENELSVEDIYLNKTSRTVKVADKEISLSFKEYELLKLFMENRDKVFSRESLLQLVWGQEYYGETRTVDVHIRTLRQKLGSSAEAIQTIRNVGYKMSQSE